MDQDSESPPPPPERIPPLPLTRGTGLALLGSAMAALSTGFAWGASLAPEAFGPQQGYLPSGVPLPALIKETSTGTTPSVGLVVLVLALLTAALVILSSAGRWADVVRRVLGLAIVAVVALFAWRYGGAADASEVGQTLFGGLRAGAYLALIGGILIAVTGPPVSQGSEPRGLDVLAEDRT